MGVETSQQFRVPATFQAVRTVDAAILNLLAEVGTDEITAYNVQLAVHEVCTNIVEHAYAGREDGIIAVSLKLVQAPIRVIEIELRDQGRAFDPDQIPAPNLEEPQEGGYGLFLARALLDDIRYEQGAAENAWHLRKVL